MTTTPTTPTTPTTTATTAATAIAVVPTTAPAYGFDLVQAFEAFTGGTEKDPEKLTIPGAASMGKDERRVYCYVASCLAADPAVGLAWRKRHAHLCAEIPYWRWSALAYLPLVSTTPDGVAECERESRALLDNLRLRVTIERHGERIERALTRLAVGVEVAAVAMTALAAAGAEAGAAASPSRLLAASAAEECARFLRAPAPKADAPKADAPKADAPKADAPKAKAPKADATTTAA